MDLLNTGSMIDFIQLYIKQIGGGGDNFNRELMREILNQKVLDFVFRTGILTTKASIQTSDEDGDGDIDQEYELPTNVVRVLKVNFDGYQASKTTFGVVDSMAGRVS